MEEALCQDCLRLVIIPNHECIENTADSENLHCSCGGDLCSCDDCQAALKDFKNGIYKHNQFVPEYWEKIKGKSVIWFPDRGLFVEDKEVERD